MISVLILTKNEAKDLPGCLASVAWSDDIHVFDSNSEDNTAALAESLGAKVTRRAFDGYASQRNAALHTLPFTHPWVLILDADERIPAALTEEMAAFVAGAPPDISACRIRRRDFFLGAHLAHAQISPFYIRLVQPGKVHYEREINEVLKVAEGGLHDLHEPFDHYPFSKGIQHWIEKHNAYSTMEARQVLLAREGQSSFSLGKALVCKDFNERRFHQKECFYRMPLRPLVKWFYMMAVRRAFLDGGPGITYAFLQAIYEYMIVIKTREMEAPRPRPARRAGRGLSPQLRWTPRG